MGDAAQLRSRAQVWRAARSAFLVTLLACGDGSLTDPVPLKTGSNPATKLGLMTPYDSLSPLVRASDDSTPTSFIVQLRDASGQAVKQAGRVLTLSVLEPSGAASTRITIRRGATTTTDTAGLASVTGLVLSGKAGPALMSAKVDSLPAVTVPFSLTAGAVSASASAVTVAPDSVPVGGVAQIVVVPMDASGNKKGANQVVTAVLDGNQALATVSAFTFTPADSSYRGSITVIGAAAPRALRANVNGTALAIAPLFTGLAPVAGGAAGLKMAILPGDTIVGFTPRSGAVWPSTAVQLVDAGGTPVRLAGIAVTARSTTTAGAPLTSTTILNGGPVSTDASGQAVFPGITYTSQVGPQRIRFEAAGLTPASFPVNVKSGVISATNSTMTVSNTAVVVDSTITITVIPKDAFGNPHGGGSGLALTASGGTSTGVFGSVGYFDADSTYKVTFTGKTTGTPITISANLNGVIINATVQVSVIVQPGAPVAASPVTVTPDTIAVGGVSQLVTTPLDGAGKKIGPGLSVSVTLSGGTSAATVGAVTYSAADSSYRAGITGVTAGTMTSVTTKVSGVTLSATRPLTVKAAGPPPPDPATNLKITVTPDTSAGGALIQSGGLLGTVTVSLRTASGVAVAQSGVPVTVTPTTTGGAAWSGATLAGGGPLSTGADGTVSFPALRLTAPVGAGRLKFSATGLAAAGIPVRIAAGALSASVSTFTLTPDTVAVSSASVAVVTPKDAQGNKLGAGQTVTFALGAGSSGITIGATSYIAGDSTYRAPLTGTTIGTTRTVTASVASVALTTTRPLTVIAQAAADVSATVDGTTTYPISRFIYGANFATEPGMWSNGTPPAELTFNRMGGNRMSAYNWENNYSQAGSDYNFQNDQFLSGLTTPGDAVSSRAATSFARNQGFLATIPMIGYVAGDACGCNVGSTDADRVNRLATHFKVSKPTKGSAFSLTPSPTDGTVYQDEFVNWANSTFPGRTGNTTAPLMFSLDNEPDIWNGTHKEIMSDLNDNSSTPRQIEYGPFSDTTVAYAAAIKAVAPNSIIFGAVTATYTGITLAGRYPNPDPVYGTQNFTDVFLDRMKAAETAKGKRLLDVLDVHFYTEAGYGTITVGNDYGTQDANMINARVQAPRSLWDPTYTDNSWVAQVTGGPIRLIPRLKDQIAAHYPGTKLSITEYYYGRGGDISGGVAQADVLGIFGREGVFAASLWPNAGIWASPYGGDGNLAYAYAFGAFRVYRNYDGAGSTFGDTGLSATTTDASMSSVYASRTTAGKTVMVVINKAQAAKTIRINLSGVGSPTTGQVYVQQNGSPNPARQADVSVTSGGITYTMPALSVSVIALN